ncbi:RraA family protein [Sporosarcina contaminans]|uniref:Putative 4-hydroxy-4-methyl-2-oxoglutarate aldolase n=1 Tax=Sporosarcina contaminans TaxID=633403 RepID=A0ABW3TUS3_9BACL
MPNVKQSEIQLLDPLIIERAKMLSTTLLSDAMGCSGAMDYGILPLTTNDTIAGTALTVKMRAGDNLFLHQAIQLGSKGYVIVADGQGHHANAYLGELMAESAKVNGLEGIVIDGLVRDKEALMELRFPIYARGFIPNGPFKDGPGEFNIPISCGGVSVTPGDLIVADADGVVVVPKMQIEQVLKKAEEKLSYEDKRKVEIQSGNTEPHWLKDKMKKFGF